MLWHAAKWQDPKSFHSSLSKITDPTRLLRSCKSLGSSNLKRIRRSEKRILQNTPKTDPKRRNRCLANGFPLTNESSASIFIFILKTEQLMRGLQFHIVSWPLILEWLPRFWWIGRQMTQLWWERPQGSERFWLDITLTVTSWYINQTEYMIQMALVSSLQVLWVIHQCIGIICVSW